MNKNTQHSVEYIKKKIDRKSGFTVPENYFNTIENKLLTDLKLKSLDGKKQFTTPKNYFENLETTILAKVTSEENKQKETKIISLQRFIPFTAAASIVFLIGFYFVNYNKTITLNDITTTDIENWYENNYGTTNHSELATILETKDFDDNEFLALEINNDALENYFYLNSNNLTNEIN